MAATMLLLVEKSLSRKFITKNSAFSKGVSTARSTIAPPGMRAAVGTPMATLEPAAEASMPVAVKAPWAKA